MNSTHDGGLLFRAEVCIWIRRELAMSESLDFSLLYADFLLVI